MIEVELKYKITDIAKIIDLLKSNDFTIKQPRIFELSEMFDNKDSLMKKTNSILRVRKIGNKVEFCYKKPIDTKEIKKEIEHETEVKSYDELLNILTKIEFSKISSYERYRTVYTNKDNIKISIDEYPFATYLEIEGDENKIIDISNKFNFDLKDNLIDPCDTLFSKWRLSQSLKPSQHMLFSNFDK